MTSHLPPRTTRVVLALSGDPAAQIEAVAAQLGVVPDRVTAGVVELAATRGLIDEVGQAISNQLLAAKHQERMRLDDEIDALRAAANAATSEPAPAAVAAAAKAERRSRKGDA